MLYNTTDAYKIILFRMYHYYKIIVAYYLRKIILSYYHIYQVIINVFN